MLLVPFLVGTTFFAALPVYATPIVLQADEVPRFWMGLAAAGTAGLALGLLSGGPPNGMSLVVACTFVGASLNGIFYAIPEPDIEEPWYFDVALVAVNFAYMFSPAVVGLVLAWLAHSLLGWLLRRDVPQPPAR